MRNETVSVPWLCLSVTSQETRFNRASPGPSREGEGKKCLLASHDCQTWCSGGTAAVGEAGVGSHSCAQVLILWFVSLVAAFPGCSLWGVLRNALWGPAQGVGVCEEHGHVGDLTFPVMVETSTSACSAVCMPRQPLRRNPCHPFVSKGWNGGIVSANQRCVSSAGEARGHAYPVLCDPGPCSFPSSLLSAQTCAAPLLTRPLS